MLSEWDYFKVWFKDPVTCSQTWDREVIQAYWASRMVRQNEVSASRTVDQTEDVETGLMTATIQRARTF